mgnify:CR=1 FL=1
MITRGGGGPCWAARFFWPAPLNRGHSVSGGNIHRRGDNNAYRGGYAGRGERRGRVFMVSKMQNCTV